LVLLNRRFLNASFKHTANLVLLFTSVLCFNQVAAIDLTGFTTTSTTYKIDTFTNCSALWSVTFSVPLSGEGDVERFREYIQNFTASKPEFLEPFRVLILQLVEQASNMTGRNMSATYFDVTAAVISTATISRGTITYRFLWTGFLEGAADTLYMGDVFEGGLYLYENDSIAVYPPAGYRADFASPKPDASNGAIVWHGPMNFPSGEPSIEFISMETRLHIEFEGGELTEGDRVTIQGRIEPPMAIPVQITYTRPDGRTSSQTVASSELGLFALQIEVDEPGGWRVQASWEGNEEYLGSESGVIALNVRSALNPYALVAIVSLLAALAIALMVWYRGRRPTAKDIPPPPEDDEEKVLALLSSSGGRIFQKDVCRILGFSKSKTTAILNSLEAKGKIVKEKRGRRYLVKLAA